MLLVYLLPKLHLDFFSYFWFNVELLTNVSLYSRQLQWKILRLWAQGRTELWLYKILNSIKHPLIPKSSFFPKIIISVKAIATLWLFFFPLVNYGQSWKLQCCHHRKLFYPDKLRNIVPANFQTVTFTHAFFSQKTSKTKIKVTFQFKK